MPELSLTALCASPAAPFPIAGLGALVGPATPIPIPTPGGPLLVRGGAFLGGGGVALLVSACSAPAFLLIQRFNSGS